MAKSCMANVDSIGNVVIQTLGRYANRGKGGNKWHYHAAASETPVKDVSHGCAREQDLYSKCSIVMRVTLSYPWSGLPI